MRQTKSNRITRHQLMLTAILLLACLSLLAAATWARYRTDEVWYLSYTTKPSDSVHLWSSYNEDTGKYSETQSSWVLSNGYGTLDFYVSNGTPEAPTDEDQQVSIRLLASLAVLDYVDEVSLYVTEGGTTKVWSAESLQIEKGTALYQTFGDGQIYIFRDETGAEQSWMLNGGTLSVLPAQIEIQGLDQSQDMALLQLQISSN